MGIFDPLRHDLVLGTVNRFRTRRCPQADLGSLVFVVCLAVFLGVPFALALINGTAFPPPGGRAPATSYWSDDLAVISWGIFLPPIAWLLASLYAQIGRGSRPWCKVVLGSRSYVWACGRQALSKCIGLATVFAVFGSLSSILSNMTSYHHARACTHGPAVGWTVDVLFAVVKAIICCFALQSALKLATLLEAVVGAFRQDEPKVEMHPLAPDGLMGVGTVGTAIVKGGGALLVGALALLGWRLAADLRVGTIGMAGGMLDYRGAVLWVLVGHVALSLWLVGRPMYAVHGAMMRVREREMAALRDAYDQVMRESRANLPGVGPDPSLTLLSWHEKAEPALTAVRSLPVWPVKWGAGLWAVFQVFAPLLLEVTLRYA